jgi:hypothetical protein
MKTTLVKALAQEVHMKSVITHELTLETLGDVRADSLVPVEQPSSLKILVQADTYQQRFLKYPRRGTFHSYAEYLHAILLESRPSVVNFVPQPFLLLVNNRRYTPDCYVIENGERRVIELKPRGEMAKPSPDIMTRFFALYGMQFEVIANEDILRQEGEARHWLRIIQALVVAERYQLDTRLLERDILTACMGGTCCVADVLVPGRRDQWQREIALYRLLHKHWLETDLKTRHLDYDSELHYVDNMAGAA